MLTDKIQLIHVSKMSAIKAHILTNTKINETGPDLPSGSTKGPRRKVARVQAMTEPLARVAAGATLRAGLTGAAMTAMLVAYCTSPASALSEEDWDSCARSAELLSDRPIRGCTAVITAGERILAQLVAAYNNRGLAFRARGDLDRAVEDYDKAISLMPDHYVAINNRGVALMAKGELDRAITDFDQAIRLKSDYLAAFGARAAAYSRKGLFDRAIADLDVVIKADPKNQVLIRERGTMKAKIGDGVGAEADFRRAEALVSGSTAPVRPK
ncbi:tetratricopeptide repeat protein [Bradyrhizobium sp. BR13661]|jgi:tetratricopeptide (TPR) repeat protein|uniref:tetratricopeptide repeat protein n=1 Tax=Bradyrhizobium sp. BR13661 TaxID=2940622 RepID=UPI0024733C9E|nr:tetratricopeptide repeat protein [Bradyrhizobium sp. BR13661]MDH6260461.1 tetratricopeptide (TPR) repeat protein [Bradyrhizobium sp. BR13661]